MTIQEIKNRFGIIGNSPLLDRAIDIARQVAPTDLTVLITGESGVGKEVFPQIIHQMSPRKHGSYIAVNCGAIPEGTIDSELFGHEKGSFTGAHEARKGYFEVVNGGTIFLDEVAELPLSTQVRLLRVLETGEFIKVGSSKVLKTDVRVVAATNVNMHEAIRSGKFREDLYYRLSTVPVTVPSLRQRKEDILLLFRKFALDFSEKYRVPPLELAAETQKKITEHSWPGNIRHLKNLTEQLSILEKNRVITAETLGRYLPAEDQSRLPVLQREGMKPGDFSEREILYKVLFDMKKDVSDLKKIVTDIINGNTENLSVSHNSGELFSNESGMEAVPGSGEPGGISIQRTPQFSKPHEQAEVIEETLSLEEQEKGLIRKALEKYKGKRNKAAKELGISERTLYRKIKQYNLE